MSILDSDRRLKVGYVLKRYPRFSETFIVNEILALEAKGVEVTVFALRPALEGCFHENLARVRAQVEYLPATGQKASALLRQIRLCTTTTGFHFNLDDFLEADAAELEQALVISKLALDRSIDHLHAHFATSASAVARLASRCTQIPYSVTAHAKDIYHQNIDQQKLRQRLMDADAVVTVSDFNVNHLRKIFPDLRPKLHRIYNGLNLDHLKFSPYQIRAPMVLAIGRLVEKKGFGPLIRALPTIVRAVPDVRLDIVGDGVLRQELEALSNELDLTNRVRFHGALPQGEVMRMLREAAVLVAPCLIAEDGDRDGLPTVLLESMALGTPCITTSVTGIPEVIKHKDTGLLLNDTNAEVLASNCVSILESPELAASLAVNARARLAQDFDVTKNVDALIALMTAKTSPDPDAHFEREYLR